MGLSHINKKISLRSKLICNNKSHFTLGQKLVVMLEKEV